MPQPLGVHPAERVTPDVELACVVAQDHPLAKELVRPDAAPQGGLGGDAHRVGCHVQLGEAELFEVRQPSFLIGKGRLRLRRQLGDQRRRQRVLAHVGIRRVVEHVIGVAGAE